MKINLKSGKGEIQKLILISIKAFYIMFKFHIRNLKVIPNPHVKTEQTERQAPPLLLPCPETGKGSCDVTVPNS